MANISWDTYRAMPVEQVEGHAAHQWGYVAAVDAFADGLDAEVACSLAERSIAHIEAVSLDASSVAHHGKQRRGWINSKARQRKMAHDRRANKLEGSARSRLNGTSDIGAIAERRAPPPGMGACKARMLGYKVTECDSQRFEREVGAINRESKVMDDWKVMLVGGDYEGFEALAKQEVERLEGEIEEIRAELDRWTKRLRTAETLKDVE